MDNDRYKELIKNMQVQQTQTETLLVNRNDLVNTLGSDIEKYKQLNITNDMMEQSFNTQIKALEQQVKREKAKTTFLGTALGIFAALVVYLSLK